MKRVRFAVVLPAALGLLGASLIHLSTSRYGIGLTTDSAMYLSAAESLLAGNGYTTFQGYQLRHWPPLYPTLLAAVGLVWPDLAAVARYVNVLAFAILLFAITRWLIVYIGDPVLVLLGAGAVLFSIPFLAIFPVAVTEPLFLLLTTLSLFSMVAYRAHGSARSLCWSAVLAGLALLTRYVGIAVVLTGLLMIVTRTHVPRTRRLKDLALFSVVSLLLFAPWPMRNYLSSSIPIAEWYPPETTITSSIVEMFDTITSWVMPTRFSLSARLFLLATVIVTFALSIVVRRGHLDDCKDAWRSIAPCWPLMTFCTTFTILMLLSSVFLSVDPLGHRYLSPLFIPLLLTITSLVNGLTASPGTWRAVSKAVAVCAMCLWIAYPIYSTIGSMRVFLSDGPGALGTASWRQSEMIGLLKQSGVVENTFTNEPYAAYLLTGHALRESPTRQWYRSTAAPEGPSALELAVRQGGAARLVWFDVERSYLYSLDELERQYRLARVAAFPDGAVYEVRRR